ncbi:class I SAM-dependent methyltransferase [Kocuria sabuli]|uniref:class I SAM-dependent methyltransferase n=1 Tax=Kocuria sabuli TaxID=3071448 RepID=UPI0034D52DBE
MSDLRDVQHAYDTMAQIYHEHLPDLRAEQPVDRALITAFAEHVRVFDSPAVLDAGCGTGRLISTLQAGGLTVTGIDLSPGMLDIARSMHPEVPFHVADLAHLPFDSATFAGVMAWYSLIHVPPHELTDSLAEITRVLRPGGYFLTGFQAGAGNRILHHASGGDGGYEAYLWTVDEMTLALAQVGLDPIAWCTRAAQPDSYDGGHDQGFVLARKALPTSPGEQG